MSYITLEFEHTDGIGIVTVSRPKALNALNSQFFKEMNDLLDQLDETTLALIITGKEKAFVAGADIAEMQNMTRNEAVAFSKNGQNTFKRLEQLDIPVIAAVNGYALGGGCELAMACDFRIANTFAKFGLPEASLGLMPGYGGTQKLARLSGLGNALFLTLSGEMIDAPEALRIGLVQKVCEAGELIEQTISIVKKILKNGPNAIKAIKKVVRDGLMTDVDKGLDLEASEFSKLFESDGPEGMTAFLEKRKPNWK